MWANSLIMNIYSPQILLISATQRAVVPGVHLQVDEVPRNDSYARVNITAVPIPDMDVFTTCMYIKFLRGRPGYDTIVSYANVEDQNAFYLGIINMKLI